jgi:hypothetical protein
LLYSNPGVLYTYLDKRETAPTYADMVETALVKFYLHTEETALMNTYMDLEETALVNN